MHSSAVVQMCFVINLGFVNHAVLHILANCAISSTFEKTVERSRPVIEFAETPS
jgi:hypothetical protein